MSEFPRDPSQGVITALKAAGATPHTVQIGNEVTGGMLWEDGKSYPQANFPNFAALKARPPIGKVPSAPWPATPSSPT